jgi:hypothetical protein
VFSKRYRAHRCGVEVMLHLLYVPPVGHEERDSAYGTMGVYRVNNAVEKNPGCRSSIPSTAAGEKRDSGKRTTGWCFWARS